MGRILLPKEFAPGWSAPGKKPVGPVEIDWTNPLTKGLVAVHFPQVGAPILDLAGRGLFSQDGNTLGQIEVADGSVLFDTGPNTNRVRLSKPADADLGSSGLSILVKSRPRNGGTYSSVDHAFVDNRLGAGGFTYYTKNASGGAGQQQFVAYGVVALASSRYDLDPSLTSHGVIFDGSTLHYMIDGSSVETDSLSSISAGSATLNLYGRGSGDDMQAYSEFEYTLVWDRALSDKEYARVSSNPYQVLRPANDFGYTFPAAGGDTNVSATTDSLLITEQAATVNAETNVSTNVDALVITEQAADVNLNRSVSANTDALVITANTADVDLDKNVSTNVDALVLSTFAATVDLDAGIQANTASLTISGQTADVNLDKNVAANTDTLVITEFTASIDTGADTLVAAGVDNLVITEQAATINAATNVNANNDSLSITGLSAQIGLDLNISAGVDTLTLTDQPADVNLDVSVLTSAASLTLTPFSATVVATEAADVTIDGAANYVINANYGSTTLYFNGSNYFTID